MKTLPWPANESVLPSQVSRDETESEIPFWFFIMDQVHNKEDPDLVDM